jgi:hypothetical protein
MPGFSPLNRIAINIKRYYSVLVSGLSLVLSYCNLCKFSLFFGVQFIKLNYPPELQIQGRIMENLFKPKQFKGRPAANRLKRTRHPMPEFIRQALGRNGLTDAYLKRPAYQQNDYIGWIIRAKRPETRQKRLEQMLQELEAGGVYMKMPHPASEKP